MLKSFLIASCLCLSATAESSSPSPKTQPEVKVKFGVGAEDVYRKILKAIGTDKLLLMKGLEITITGGKVNIVSICTHDQLKRTSTLPDQKSTLVLDGKTGWIADLRLRELSKEEVDQNKLYCISHLADPAKSCTKVELLDVKKFNGKPCIALKFSMPHASIIAYHDPKNFLRFADESTFESPGGKFKLTNNLLDYVLMPEGFRYPSSATSTITQIDHKDDGSNIGETSKWKISFKCLNNVDPATFAKPVVDPATLKLLDPQDL